MTDKDSAQNVIESYRKRQQAARNAPLILGAAALLLIVGAAVLIFWLLGPSKPDIALFASETPTPTMTYTPTATSTSTPSPTVTPTTRPTDTPTLTPTPSGPFTYQVEEGDSLFSIAIKFNVDLLLLETINNMDPANPIIRVGEKLTIPGPDTKLPTSTPLPSNLRSGTKITYQVQPGDSLASIALAFNSTIDDIKKENDITNENEIYVGQKLSIPVNVITAVPTSTPVPPTATPTAGTSAAGAATTVAPTEAVTSASPAAETSTPGTTQAP
jgi:LysM repeat protein